MVSHHCVLSGFLVTRTLSPVDGGPVDKARNLAKKPTVAPTPVESGDKGKATKSPKTAATDIKKTKDTGKGLKNKDPAAEKNNGKNNDPQKSLSAFSTFVVMLR